VSSSYGKNMNRSAMEEKINLMHASKEKGRGEAPKPTYHLVFGL
jgi:hypothetical protein